MTEQEIQDVKEMIDTKSHLELARIYRFASSGHPMFSEPELTEYFSARFESFGGMTVTVSKQIGWGK